MSPDTGRSNEWSALAQKPSVPQLMAEQQLSVSEVATRSGVSYNTAKHAAGLDNKTYDLNTSSGRRIAGAFGTTVDQINWPGNGLSNRGRPAGPGNE